MNGRDGLMAMREIRPDIVFVDMQMPEMGGVEFLKACREEFPQAKLIVVSGFDNFHYAQSALRYGSIEYLLKPVREDELNSAIQKAVSKLPEQSDGEVPAELLPEQAAAEIHEYIQKNFCQDINVSKLADKYHYSKEYLSKHYKRKFGMGIYEYAQKLRMERAAELLLRNEQQIQDVSERLGYSNSNYFSKAFRKYFGMTPTEFRESAQNVKKRK